jgi:hypothetical protein
LYQVSDIFKEYSIFITNGNYYFQVFEDGTKKGYNQEQIITALKIRKPYKLLHKDQFEFVKPYLLDQSNPVPMNFIQLDFYHLIGFISDSEYNNFSSYLNKHYERLGVV